MSYSTAKTQSQTELSLSTAALIVAGVSFAALAGAWALQLAGYLPCPLCLEERIPYYTAVPGGLLAAYLARCAPKLAALIIAALAACFLYDAGLSIYHAGVEWHFWPGPHSCTGDDVRPTKLSDALQHNQVVRCDQAIWSFLGLSLAAYNVLISGVLAAFGGFTAFQRLTSKVWRQSWFKPLRAGILNPYGAGEDRHLRPLP